MTTPEARDPTQPIVINDRGVKMSKIRGQTLMFCGWIGLYSVWAVLSTDAATALENSGKSQSHLSQTSSIVDDLIRGVDFESERDLDDWSTDAGNTVSRSADFAAEGHYSLKLHFPEGGQRVYFKPKPIMALVATVADT